MKRTRWMRLAASTAVLSLALAACGGDGEPQAEDTGAQPAPTDTGTDDVTANRDNVDGTLKLGTLVPSTGDLAALGPPQQYGYELAIQQINEAGGVLGNDVELVSGDSGTNEQVANNTVDQHLRDNVDGILGAASSRITLSVIDKITGANVYECSPSNTGASLTEHETDVPGFYFRTAPPDNLQGPALANVIVGDGFSNVAIIALNDEYGQGFANFLAGALEEQGATVAANVAYDPSGTEFAADVQQALDADPDAIALISFPDTGSKIIRNLLEQGFDPSAMYTADGMQSAEVASLVDPNNPSVIDGMKGTAPSSQGSEEFQSAFEEFTPPDTPQIFSAHAYDCAMISALAAEVAGTDDPNEFANEVVGVTKDGEKCTTFEQCKSLIEEGTDIDYDGASGPLDFIDVGEPSAGTYEIWQFSGGEIETLDTTFVGEGEGEGGQS